VSFRQAAAQDIVQSFDACPQPVGIQPIDIRFSPGNGALTSQGSLSTICGSALFFHAVLRRITPSNLIAYSTKLVFNRSDSSSFWRLA
jgi:hypothetical protein